MIIKKDTAFQLPVLLIDDTDFKTPKTGVVHGSVTCKYAKEGDSSLTTKTIGAGNWTELGEGIYLITFTDVELDTVGKFIYNVTVSGSLNYQGLYQIQEFLNDDMSDQIWDEVLTGATHNVPSSAGRRLRSLPALVIREETAQGPGTGNNQIQLDTGASATDGAYDPSMITIIGGTGEGQCRLIVRYIGSTKVATIDRDWAVNPDATSEFIISSHPGRETLNEGKAQGGTTNTITLNATSSPYDDEYVNQLVFVRSGTGKDQLRRITGYNGTTKVATIDDNWGAIPDTTSAYSLLPGDSTELILSIINAIKAKTDNLPSDPTSETNATANKTEVLTAISNRNITTTGV